MATKILQAFRAIIELHFGGESEDRKAQLLDGMIDEVTLVKGIYKSIKKPARKQEGKKKRGGKPKGHGSTAYTLFQKSMKEAGHSCSPKQMGEMWADVKQDEPNLVAWLKIQAQLKNNGEDYDLDMPEDWEPPVEIEPEKPKKKQKKRKKKPEPESESGSESGSESD